MKGSTMGTTGDEARTGAWWWFAQDRGISPHTEPDRETFETAWDAALEWQASRKVEVTDADPEWLERVNRALWRYDQKTLDVRGVADALASQSVQVEVTDEMVDRVATATAALSTALGGGES